MAMLEAVVDPSAPDTIKVQDVVQGHVVLAGHSRIAVMRTSKEPAGMPRCYEFVVLKGLIPHTMVGTLLYYEEDNEVFAVQSAKLVIKR